MPLTTAEAIKDALIALPLANSIMESVKTFSAIPPDQRKATDVEPIIGVTPGSVIHKALAEVGDPVHKPSDVIAILDLDPNGNLAQTLDLADTVLADIAS